MKSRLLISAILSFFGLFVTAYLTYQHFSAPNTSFCNVSAIINCDVVNKSTYSELFGIPVAILGFFTYALLFLGSFGLLRGWNWHHLSTKLSAHLVLSALKFIAAIGLAFSFYLTIVEFFVLQAVCIFCLTQQFLILGIFFALMPISMHSRE